MCIGYIAMIAIGTMLIAYFQHICGMLSISRYKTNTEKIVKILIYKENCIIISDKSKDKIYFRRQSR